AALGRAAMDRAVFTQHIAVADLHPAARFGREAHVLRRPADQSTVSDAVAAANYHFAFNDDIRANSSPMSHPHVFADDGVRPHLHIRAESCAWFDDGAGVDHQS